MDENKSVDAWLSFAFVSPPPSPTIITKTCYGGFDGKFFKLLSGRSLRRREEMKENVEEE